MKKATATSHGKRRLAASVASDEDGGTTSGPGGFIEGNSGGLTATIMLADEPGRCLLIATD
jgi:hypothetical protein